MEVIKPKLFRKNLVFNNALMTHFLVLLRYGPIS